MIKKSQILIRTDRQWDIIPEHDMTVDYTDRVPNWSHDIPDCLRPSPEYLAFPASLEYQ